MTTATASVGKSYRSRMVSYIKEGVKNSDSVFLLTYSKISSNQISDLRKNLKKVGAKVYVTKNAFARIALKDLAGAALTERIEGQTAFILTNSDCVEVSKALLKTIKGIEGFKVKGGLLKERILENEDVKRLADLPSREVLLAQLLSIIQAPVTQLLYALNAKSQDLLSILKQLSEKKGGN
ncbi:MAG: 50S ribosomal protein L10 [Omnitrophica WOR_2 bacterium GWA2_47_8]|nr:MAG: 50S ribosomal protein L10 [Omnitrophica WOR_2 bacterium GWA2_47_8]